MLTLSTSSLANAVSNPQVAIPLAAVALSILVRTVYYARRYDWYNLYLGFSAMGLELCVLSIGIFASASTSEGRKLFNLGAQAGDGEFAFLLIGSTVGLLIAFALALWLFAEAKTTGRRQFPLAHKFPFLRSHFRRDVFTTLVDGLDDGDYRTGLQCLAGYACCAASLGIGVASLHLVIRAVA